MIADCLIDKALDDITTQNKDSSRTDPFAYSGEELNLSSLFDSATTSEGEIRSAVDGLPDKYLFEIMFVEVKGPNDHLAYKQLLWLHILDQKNSSTGGQGGVHGMKAVVCHVKE